MHTTTLVGNYQKWPIFVGEIFCKMLLWLLLALGLFCICLNHPQNLFFAPKTCLLF